jgi:hypothetical protein
MVRAPPSGRLAGALLGCHTEGDPSSPRRSEPHPPNTPARDAATLLRSSALSSCLILNFYPVLTSSFPDPASGGCCSRDLVLRGRNVCAHLV